MKPEEFRNLTFENVNGGEVLETENEYLRLAIGDLERAGKDPGEPRKVMIQLELSRTESTYSAKSKVRVRLGTDYPDLVDSVTFKREDPNQLTLLAGGKR